MPEYSRISHPPNFTILRPSVDVRVQCGLSKLCRWLEDVTPVLSIATQNKTNMRLWKRVRKTGGLAGSRGGPERAGPRRLWGETPKLTDAQLFVTETRWNGVRDDPGYVSIHLVMTVPSRVTCPPFTYANLGMAPIEYRPSVTARKSAVSAANLVCQTAGAAEPGCCSQLLLRRYALYGVSASYLVWLCSMITCPPGSLRCRLTWLFQVVERSIPRHDCQVMANLIAIEELLPAVTFPARAAGAPMANPAMANKATANSPFATMSDPHGSLLSKPR